MDIRSTGVRRLENRHMVSDRANDIPTPIFREVQQFIALLLHKLCFALEDAHFELRAGYWINPHGEDDTVEVTSAPFAINLIFVIRERVIATRG